jgi:hypothetical protein
VAAVFMQLVQMHHIVQRARAVVLMRLNKVKLFQGVRQVMMERALVRPIQVTEAYFSLVILVTPLDSCTSVGVTLDTMRPQRDTVQDVQVVHQERIKLT